MATRKDVGCDNVANWKTCPASVPLVAMKDAWEGAGWHWLENYGNNCDAHIVDIDTRSYTFRTRHDQSWTLRAICH